MNISSLSPFINGVQQIYTEFDNYWKAQNKKKACLDFMGTVLMIAVLGFRKMSKIKLMQYKIAIQPNTLITKGFRTGCKDSRLDLGALRSPICSALVSYPPKTKNLQNIYKACQRGFEELKITYFGTTCAVNDLIYQSLTTCISILDQEVKKYENQNLNLEIAENDMIEHEKQDSEVNKYLYSETLRNNVVHENLWNSNTIDACAILLQQANDSEGTVREGFLTSVMSVVNCKQESFEKIAINSR